ncbi:MAG TPA: hypothetical protein VFD58_33350 [Blastocatellia bacterium]|nr:hypothetical protein [Blastocatellia bacterium]
MINFLVASSLGSSVNHDNSGGDHFFHLFNFEGDHLGIHFGVPFFGDVGVDYFPYRFSTGFTLVPEQDSGGNHVFDFFNFQGNDIGVHFGVPFFGGVRVDYLPCRFFANFISQRAGFRGLLFLPSLRLRG